MEVRNVVMASVLAMTLNACASTAQNPDETNKLAASCDKNLSIAYQELDFANANGFSGSWEYTKAASLLGTARVQSGFGAYEDCIDKVKTAQAYIKESKQ
ncbi:hypothetical protein [Sulfuriflexus mobilis]|uniref:hypothetical protein n=1 Tax=Sulfuriflexus mobilis TaxID=1811807 RepID=UPI000F81FC7B|nr:hypothetical protein [Sulfuriflexus mobilis]